jgi:hypothetical protein
VEKLWPVLRNLVTQVKTEHGVQIIIVGSLAEGMGSVLLDVSHLATQAAYCVLGKGTEVNVYGYLSLTSDQDSDPPGVSNTLPLNTIASLRELERFRLHPGLPLSLGYRVPFEECSGTTVGDVRTRPFTYLYLFGDSGDRAEQDLYPAMADLIALRLDRETWSVQDAGEQQDRLRKERYDSEKREHARYELHFGTAGIKSVQIPVCRHVEQLKIRFARGDINQFFVSGNSREHHNFDRARLPDLLCQAGRILPCEHGRAASGRKLNWKLDVMAPSGALLLAKALHASLISADECCCTRLRKSPRNSVNTRAFMTYC